MRDESQDVPAKLRAEVYDRDNLCCRVCGQHVGERAGLHHVHYRSEGGRNELSNLITIGWLPGHDCHLPVVHANKKLWQPILEVVAVTDGLNARQLLRWARERENGMTVPEVGARACRLLEDDTGAA